MSLATPRLRMFAGPNSSGKSTIKAVVEDKIGPELLGVYINPDEMERDIRTCGVLDLSAYGVETSAEEVLVCDVVVPCQSRLGIYFRQFLRPEGLGGRSYR